jgi:hypothetical protein
LFVLGGIGQAAFLVAQPRNDDSDGQPQEPVDAAHPLGIALGEIVVHGHDMNALAFEGVEIDGQGRDQRLALAGFHLRDHAHMLDDAAHELDVEMALAEGPFGRLAHRCESVFQDLVEGFAVAQPLAQQGRAATQFFVSEGFHLRLDRADRGDLAFELLEEALIGGAEDSLRESA